MWRIRVTSQVLVATWSAGLFLVSDGTPQQELPNRSVRALAPDSHGGALAIVDGRSLSHRSAAGVWSTIATADMDLACCAAVGDNIYIGTDNALVLRVSAAGEIEQLRGFERVAGRDKWYAGTALINGKLVGPPLGVRSITATSDGSALLANVHVGGIPRSADAGATWQPTIDIERDVHGSVRIRTVQASWRPPRRLGFALAPTAARHGRSNRGALHALHCSAVAFAGDDILLSAADSPFAAQGAIYRRGVDERSPLVRVTGGLPAWLDGIAHTGCIAVSASAAALADMKGNLYVSADNGHTWSCQACEIPTPISVLIV
jgi:hypothetical protein